MPDKKSEKPTFLFIFRTPQNQPDPSPEEMQQIFGKWMNWMKTMEAKGQYLGGEPLGDSGNVLRNPRGSTLTDGPFVEAKEVVGGYMMVVADTLAQAVELARDCPGLERGGSVEVRAIEKLPAHV
jgi:hypothetical protein